MSSIVKLHYQPLILTQPGQLPTVPDNRRAKPGDPGWRDTDLLVGQTAYNVADNRIYIRTNNEIAPYKSTMYFRQDVGSPTEEVEVLHKLGFYPSVTILDTYGNEIEANVNHVNDFKLVVKFNQPFTGKIILT